MTGRKDPQLIDLARYKKAVQEKARAEAKARERRAKVQPPTRPGGGGKEPLLGSRPHAGLILMAATLIALALWLGPRFL